MIVCEHADYKGVYGTGLMLWLAVYYSQNTPTANKPRKSVLCVTVVRSPIVVSCMVSHTQNPE